VPYHLSILLFLRREVFNITEAAVDSSGFFAVYKYLFMIALLLIGGISVFVVLGIKKAQEENKEIARIQQATLEAVKECVSVMKEVRDKLDSLKK